MSAKLYGSGQEDGLQDLTGREAGVIGIFWRLLNRPSAALSSPIYRSEAALARWALQNQLRYVALCKLHRFQSDSATRTALS